LAIAKHDDATAAEIPVPKSNRSVSSDNTKPILDDCLGTTIALHGFLQESQGGFSVPGQRDNAFQNLARVIEGPSTEMGDPVDLHNTSSRCQRQ
jgi:hypothetical protein